MKRYDISNFYCKDKNRYIVFSTSYISPLKFIDEIELELSNQVFDEIEVLFDLLLRSGNDKERYGVAVYKEKKFDRSSFKYIKVEKSSPIRRISANYYKEKTSYVENSILNSVQKKMICKGISI